MRQIKADELSKMSEKKQMGDERFKVGRMRNRLREIMEMAVQLQQDLEGLDDQSEQSFYDMSKDECGVKEGVMLAVKNALDRPGCAVSMGESRVVDRNRSVDGGFACFTPCIFGPTTFQLTVVYDERRKG